MQITVKSSLSAFTLVEIMIVVMIIGLLASVALPAARKAMEEARITQAEADLEIISSAVNQLAWDTGQWPGGSKREITSSPETWDLMADSAGLVNVNTNVFDSTWDGPYLADVPTDPWGNEYFFDPDYYVDSSTRVVVGSFGPNGIGPNKYDEDDVYVLLD